MTASAPPLPRILGQIKPRPRWREARLLAIVAAAILAGSVSLELARHSDETAATAGFSPAEPLHLAIYLGVLVAAHVAQVLTGRRTDQVLLPAVGLLGGISLLLMERLPQDLVVQRFSAGSAWQTPARLARAVDQHRDDAGDRRPVRRWLRSTSTRGRPPASGSCC